MFQCQIENGSMKNYRFDNVKQYGNLTADDTKCGENYSSVR